MGRYLGMASLPAILLNLLRGGVSPRRVLSMERSFILTRHKQAAWLIGDMSSDPALLPVKPAKRIKAESRSRKDHARAVSMAQQLRAANLKVLAEYAE